MKARYRLLATALVLGGCASQPVPVASARPDAVTAAIPVAKLVDESAINRFHSYPLWSRRLGEQGDVTIKFWVDERGGASRPEVIVSSGYPRLDLATLDWLKDATPEFRILMAEGRPVPGWQRLTMRWRLH
jgi:TonB family protein